MKALFYKHSSALVEALPGPTVAVWKGKKLSPTKLLPSLVRAEAKHAIAFLEHALGESSPGQEVRRSQSRATDSRI